MTLYYKCLFQRAMETTTLPGPTGQGRATGSTSTGQSGGPGPTSTGHVLHLEVV